MYMVYAACKYTCTVQYSTLVMIFNPIQCITCTFGYGLLPNTMYVYSTVHEVGCTCLSVNCHHSHVQYMHVHVHVHTHCSPLLFFHPFYRQ